MTREEVQKLLGGYATGTLTPEEQQALYSAALEDQELFDALANEQSLRDLLRDPAARAEVLAALDAPPPARAGWIAWMRRPWVAGLAMAGIAAVSVAVWKTQRTAEPEPQLVAKVEPQPAPAQTLRAPTIEPAPAPATPKLEARRDAVRREADTDKVASAAASAPAAAIAPPAAPAAQPAELKDMAAPTVLAENKPQVLQLAPSGQQTAGQNAIQNAFQNGQNAAPSPMAQNMTTLGQQQGFRQSDTPMILTGQNGILASGRGGRGALKKAEAIAPAFKITVIRNGIAEADAATPLPAGEAVKLRIVPNADGFLYAMDGNTPLANAQVKAQQQFETPELKSDGAGQRQIRIILSSTPMAAGIAGVIGGVPQSNTRAVLAQAKEKVAQEAQQPIEQTVTLTWR
jgi:hypothetical protein